MFKNWNWGDTFLLLLFSMCIILGSLFARFVLDEKKIVRYSLDSGTSDQSLVILKEIDWYQDVRIPLDRSVSYWDAIRMIDSLNAGLKK